MKLVGVISTAVLSLILGVAAPVFAQEQHEQEDQKAKPRAGREKSAAREVRKARGKTRSTAREERQAGREKRKTGTACRW